MRQIVTTITQGGQITLPAEVRRLLGVKPRDKVAFAIDGDEVRVVPVRWTVKSVAGSVGPPTTTEDIVKAVKAAREEMADLEAAKLRRQ